MSADEITRTPWGSVERRTAPPQPFERQLDYVANQLAQMEADMIDPREFGRLEADVKALKAQVADLSSDVKALLQLANQSRGAIWAGMGIASAIGGAVSWVVSHWK